MEFMRKIMGFLEYMECIWNIYIYMEYIWNIWTYPLEICYSLLLKMTIENVDLPSGKWWFFIAMLVYQRVIRGKTTGQGMWLRITSPNRIVWVGMRKATHFDDGNDTSGPSNSWDSSKTEKVSVKFLNKWKKVSQSRQSLTSTVSFFSITHTTEQRCPKTGLFDTVSWICTSFRETATPNNHHVQVRYIKMVGK